VDLKKDREEVRTGQVFFVKSVLLKGYPVKRRSDLLVIVCLQINVKQSEEV